MDKRQLIYDAAKAIFSEKGFKDTNISAIAKSAGIAVGTFYLYYSSKDQLFMDMFRQENIALKQHCLEEMDLTQSPLNIVRQLLRLNQEGIISNPVLREWYFSEEFRKIERVYREEHAIDSLNFLYDTFLNLVRLWQSEGKMRSDIDSLMIMKVFESIINVDTHKDEIGLEYFPQLLDHLTELVMKGLTDCSA